MALLIECPTCSRRVNVPEAAAGKKVKCPGCDGYMTVPALEADKGFEVVTEPKRRSGVRRDDDDDRPRRPIRPRDDDEDDDRTRRPRRAAAPAGLDPQTKKYLIFGGGGLATLLVLLGGLWAIGVFGGKKGSGSLKGAPPAGWTKVDDDDFTAFMPGSPNSNEGGVGNRTVNGVKVEERGVPPEGTSRQVQWVSTFASTETTFTVYARTYVNKTVGTTEAFLLDEAGKIAWTTFSFQERGRKTDALSQTMTTAAGKPCLEFKYQEADWFGYTKPRKEPAAMPNFPGPVARGPNADEINRQFEEARRLQQEMSKQHEANMEKAHQEGAARWLKKRKQGVARVVADDKRIYLLVVETTGQEPDPEMVKIFFDSFEPK